MILFAGFCAALIPVLALLHMRKPRYLTRRISAARFFDDFAAAENVQTQWRWTNPLKSPPFVLQALCLLLISAALASEDNVWYTVDEPGDLHLWVWVDTSSSMATQIDDTTMLDLARAAWREHFDALAQQQRRPILHLTAFDLEQRDLGHNLSPTQFEAALAALKPRPLGTDLSLPLHTRESDENQPQGATPLVLVFSDCPVPAWVGAEPNARLVWHDVGGTVANHGFSEVRAVRNPFLGGQPLIEIAVHRYGPAIEVRLQIKARNDVFHDNLPIRFQADRGTYLFTPPQAGIYELTLHPQDAYGADNHVVFQVQDGSDFAVDWHHPDKTWLDQLGWRRQPENAVFTVLAPHQLADSDTQRPRLIVGNGFQPGESRINWFREGSPLLDQVNLDVAETLSAQPTPDLPDLFPVLADSDDVLWVGRHEAPTTVYLAGFPTGVGDQARLTTLLWFNAVRTLLSKGDAQPLFGRTRIGAATVETTQPPFRLDLHPGEGRTWLPTQSHGLEQLTATEAPTTVQRSVLWWPWLLAAALLFFVLERVLAVIGGPAWR